MPLYQTFTIIGKKILKSVSAMKIYQLFDNECETCCDMDWYMYPHVSTNGDELCLWFDFLSGLFLEAVL